jgi:hypothetical protein
MMCPAASKGIQPLLASKSVVPQATSTSLSADASSADVSGNETGEEGTDKDDLLPVEMDIDDTNSESQQVHYLCLQ